MEAKRQIEVTADGSHTLFVPELDEHYHSINGAIQESMHVFINAGLVHCSKEKIRIFEVGFGTGLNAFLSLANAVPDNRMIDYTAIEAYPVEDSIIARLNYVEGYSQDFQDKYRIMHECEWNVANVLDADFTLTKIQGDFTNFDFTPWSGGIDLIYFDAFAPDKQPEMWSQKLFDNLFEISAAGGVLVTYCAKGVVRRMMQQAGYTTERLPGPPGKREMLRATRPRA